MPPKKNQKTPKRNARRLWTLYGLGLLLAVSAALPAYIQSNFLKQFVGLEIISLFFIVANSITVAAILFYPRFIEKFTNYFTTKIILVVHAASLLGFVLTNGPWSAFLVTILFTITTNLVWINMDVLIENFSSYKTVGQTRTIYFTFINLGWIISPLFSSYLISKGEYNLTFLVAAAMIVPFFLIFFYQRKNLKDNVRSTPPPRATSRRCSRTAAGR